MPRQIRKPLSQNDIFKGKFVNSAALSPDGKTVAYVLSETTKKNGKEKQSTSIWITDIGGGNQRRLTRGSGSDSNPQFTAGGEKLLFLSTRNKIPQIYSIDIHGGEAEPITSLPQGAGAFKISPNGKWIAFAASSTPVDKTLVDGHQRIVRSWYRFDPLPGYLQNTNHGIYLLRVGGGKAKVITPYEGLITAIIWAPDSQSMAYTVTGLSPHEIFESNLNVVTVKGQRQMLFEKKVLSLQFWRGDQLGYFASPSNLAAQNQLMLINVNDGSISKRTRNLGLMVGGAVQIGSPARTLQTSQLSEDGSEVYIPVSAGGELRIYSIGLSGRQNCEVIIGGERVCHLLGGGVGQLLFTSQDLNTPPELFSIDTASGEETQLTDHNRSWCDKVRWPDTERLLVNSATGIEIEGWVLKPKHVRAPYKTILCIHGGPHAGFGYSFNCDYQELVGAGYAVVTTNPRGSTGYGDKFSQSIIGDWGNPEAKDFNAVLNDLVKRGIAHKDKLGVTGVSGGGHLSAWLIGHSKRFKAAVPEQGVYNMLSMWGTSDAGKALIELEMGGEIAKIPLKYWELSPIAYASQCTTPTLLIQGEDDIRCPMEQAEQMFTALEHHGCEVELLRLKHCNHGAQVGGDPSLRRFRMDAMKDWFKRHIG